MNMIVPVSSPSDTMACVNIPITDDNLIEGDETFTATITLIASVNFDIGDTVITITDDEGEL